VLAAAQHVQEFIRQFDSFQDMFAMVGLEGLDEP
jgi:hypothetical protein